MDLKHLPGVPRRSCDMIEIVKNEGSLISFDSFQGHTAEELCWDATTWQWCHTSTRKGK